VEHIIAREVPPNRRKEMLDYLKLFGYNPDRTILQVHFPGFFNKRRKGPLPLREAAIKRYGGTTFVVVGRTHDPSIMDQVIKPTKKHGEASPGYVGYLWKNKDPQGRAPHEVIPLDFTPIHVRYPQDWKGMLATKGFLITLHVPSSFAKDKNRLSRTLYHAGKTADVKKRWNFIDEARGAGYGQAKENPLDILKVKAFKGRNRPDGIRKIAPYDGSVIPLSRKYSFHYIRVL
jgi:hypothetical protein